MTKYGVEEVDGDFVLPIAGFVCVGVSGGEGLIVRSEDTGDEAELPADDEEMAQQLVARRARVERAIATSNSTLRVEFDGGAVIEIPPSDTVEAWEVRGPGDVLVFAMPGGGKPAFADATSKTYVIQGGVVPPELDEALEAQFKEMEGEGE